VVHRVKASVGAILIMALGDTPALAQRAVIMPESSAPTSNYSSAPMPNNNGGADYGAALRGPDGRICVTTPGLIGKPQYGTITTCYPDLTRTEQKPAGRSTLLDSELTETEVR
jgi:hypothetical protein